MSISHRSSLAAPFAALALLAALVAGCAGSDGPGTDAGRAPTPTAGTPSAEPTPYDPPPWKAIDGPLGRCGPVPQRVAAQRFRLTTLRDPGRATLPAVTAGRGRTVAILLHQTDGNGLCGWLSFAQRVAHEPGVMALAPDLCGYGESQCAGDWGFERQTDQVSLAIDHAARALRARRIVLVGASMGGSLAVLTGAADHRVDAVVDLSGPAEWRDRFVHRAASRLTVPALVAMAEDEGPEEVSAARKAVAAAPGGSEFVEPANGHGYELLEEPDGRPTPLSDRVLAWIHG